MTPHRSSPLPRCRPVGAVALLTGLLLWAGLLLAAPSEASGGRLEIADGTGHPVLICAQDGDRLILADGDDKPLLAGRREGRARTFYSLPDGTALGEARGEGEHFELIAPDGHLLRKVKREGDRIKIADNEENADAAVLRRRGEDKWELELDKSPFGKIKSYPDQGRLKVKDRGGETRYILSNAPLTPAPLALLIPHLPPAQAHAVLAEIWLRGW